MYKTLVEGKFGHGAVKINPIHRKFNKLCRNKLGKSSLPFDWTIGFDVRNKIGQITIKNQGESSSCSGQAGAYFLEIQGRLNNGSNPISAKSIYAPIAFNGGGTTIPCLETQLAVRGAELEVQVPSYDAYGNPLTEVLFVEQSWLTSPVVADMLSRAGYTPYDIGTNIDDVASAIQNYGSIIIEITGQNGLTPNWLSPTPTPPISDTGTWRHFMCCIGAKLINGKKYIIALNSWGTTVGDFGIQYISEDYFNNGVVDCFTMIHDSKISSLPPSMKTWSDLVQYFKSLWAK